MYMLYVVLQPDPTPHVVRQYQFVEWGLEQKTPNPGQLLTLMDQVRTWNSNKPSGGKTIVQCLYVPCY